MIRVEKNVALLIVWDIQPTSRTITESNFSISIKDSSGEVIHYRDSELTFGSFVAPTATVAGSMTSYFTPTEYGNFKITLNEDNPANNAKFTPIKTLSGSCLELTTTTNVDVSVL